MESPVFTQSTVKQNTTKKRPLKEYYDLDGLNCSICMEPWTSDGHHQVSCLPCGHIYGLSCIEKWIQVKGTHYAKCPQCKSYVGLRDVRKLYASPVIMVHENRLKKDERPKSAYLETKKHEMSKAAYLETERSNLLLIQDSLLKELRLLKINMEKATENGQIMLPTSTKDVKDLHISPCGRLALLASLGKKLSIISMGGSSVVMTYNLPKPAWSCSWDNDNPNYMYAGLQNGMLLVYDLRHTVHPVQSMQGLDSRPIHTIHPFEHNTSHPQNARQLLTASSVGPCVWNINGGMERAFKLPQLASEEAPCMSLAYSSASENIVATYGPKTQMKDSLPTPSYFRFGGYAPSSLVLVNRVHSSFYFKSTSTSAQLGDAGITKSTIINVNNCLPMFAYGNDVTNGLKLLEVPSLAVTQNLKPHQHPILDVRYSQSQGSCVLGCISADTLQLFSAKVS